MAAQPSVGDVVEEMYQSVMATPKRQRRLRSKTFWANFGFKHRTKDRVEQVKESLEKRGLLLSIGNGQLGTESKDEWIVLSFVDPTPGAAIIHSEQPDSIVPTPADQWFDLMASREFESEREVEYYFIVPLLEQLNYVEDDFAIGFPVQMYEGVKKVNKEADFVMFAGRGRAKADALLVVEAKRSGHIVTEDAVGQARAYALWLTTPYYLVTNGDEIRIYLFRGAVQPDVLLTSIHRRDLKQHWALVYNTLNKDSVIEYKAKLLAVLEGASKL